MTIATALFTMLLTAICILLPVGDITRNKLQYLYYYKSENAADE